MTLLELATVMVIIGILVTMLMPVYSSYLQRVDQAKCLANLRNLYSAASGYLQANGGSWPQVPISMKIEDPKKYARSWVDVLTPFGAPHAVWICPTIQRETGLPMSTLDNEETYRIDFLPTNFDDRPASPRRWARYPWFMEKGDSHGRGNLMIFSDGSTASVKDLLPDRGGGQ